MRGLEEQLGGFFLEKLPSLPLKVKEQAAKFMPWVLIVFGILGLLTWFSAVGLFRFANMVAFGLGQATGQIPVLSLLFMYLLAPVMQVLAIVGGYLMLNRQFKGWRIAFYSVLLSFVVHLGYLSIFGIFWDVVFAYLLFQIKAYYPEF